MNRVERRGKRCEMIMAGTRLICQRESAVYDIRSGNLPT